MSAAAKSWGHAIRRLTPDEIAENEGRHAATVARWPDLSERSWHLDCHVSYRCGRRATHLIQYSYVTGRGGRVSYAQKQVCEEHARKFAEKYKPTHDAADERVNEWAVRAITGGAP